MEESGEFEVCESLQHCLLCMGMPTAARVSSSMACGARKGLQQCTR